jgi:hypothetical protein
MKPQWDIRQYLRALNLTPQDVRYLILSHLHIDHAGALRYFPQSWILVQRDEYRFAYYPPAWAAANYRKADFDYPDQKWKLVDGDYCLFKGATLILSQGHSPGTQALNAGQAAEIMAPQAIAAFTAATATAWLTVVWLLRFIQRRTFIPFAWYRLALGAVMITLVVTGII